MGEIYIRVNIYVLEIISEGAESNSEDEEPINWDGKLKRPRLSSFTDLDPDFYSPLIPYFLAVGYYFIFIIP